MKVLIRSIVLSLALVSLTSLVSSAAPSDAMDNPLPRLISAVTPERPEIFGFLLKGTVVVSFTVTAEGNVVGADIQSSTDYALELPALLAVKTWKFAPATEHGLPVSRAVLQTLRFN